MDLAEERNFIERIICIICHIMQEHYNDNDLNSECISLERAIESLNGYANFKIFQKKDLDILNELCFVYQMNSIYAKSNDADIFRLKTKYINHVPEMIERVAPKLYDIIWLKWYDKRYDISYVNNY